MKANLYPDDILVLWAAKRCGRPVKWTATRSESLLCDNHARDQVVYAELALDENGKFLAIRSTAYQALGAYWWAAATAPLFWSLMFVPSLYDVQTIDIKTNAVFTNTDADLGLSRRRPAGSDLSDRASGRSRGADHRHRPGRVAAAQSDQAGGVALSHADASHLRQRRIRKADGSMPDAGRLERVRRAAARESERRGKLRGRAVTPYIELGGVFNDRMEIRFDPGGMVSIVAGTHSHGQGHATAFAQLVAEWLGVPFEAINYIQGDTEKVMFGRGTFAARSSLVGGNALRNAADVVIARGKEMAGALMEAAPADIEFNAGTFTVIGTDKQMSIGDVARAFFAPAGPVIKLGLGLDGVGT